MKKIKKGFTLVELLVVIAILAILATVSILGYSSFTKKAQTSADEQAVAQMNVALQANSVLDLNTIQDCYNVLAEGGYSAENYKPLVSDRYFFWDKELNLVVYTDKDYKVLVPSKYEGKTKDTIESGKTHQWLSLSGEIKTTEVAVTEGAATISTAEEFYYLFSEPECHGAKTVTITANIDAMGANVEMSYAANSGAITINGGGYTVSNAMQNTYKEVGVGANEGKVYISGFIPEVKAGNTITLKDISFKDCEFGDLGTGMVGIVGKVAKDGKVVFDNVDIDGCTFNGNNKVGSFVGWVQGSNTTMMDSVEIKSNCSLKDVTINTSKGESGKIIGAITNCNVNVIIASEVVSGMNNVVIKYAQLDNYTLFKGPVTLVNANSSNATQDMIDNLSGIIRRGESDYRPFSENALFMLYSTDTTTTKINGIVMPYQGNSNQGPTISVNGLANNITFATKCWYAATELPTE